MNATFLDESGQAAADADGLLRHRRHAHRRRRDRAEPRRARHHLAGRDRAVRGRARARSATTGAPTVREAADKLYAELQAAGVDVLLDDRGERPGVHVRRLGADRRAASRRARRARPRRKASSSTRRRRDERRRPTCRWPTAVGFVKGRARRRMIVSAASLAAILRAALALAGGGTRAVRSSRGAAGRLGAHARFRRQCRQRAAADWRFDIDERRPALARRDERAPRASACRTARRALEFLRTVWYEATRAGLDPRSCSALIQVESGFRKYAMSRAGARGYMQVMPFWARLIGDGDASRPVPHADQPALTAARSCATTSTSRRGDLYLALGRYNGSRGRPEYPNLVLSAWRGRWKYDGPTA